MQNVILTIDEILEKCIDSAAKNLGNKIWITRNLVNDLIAANVVVLDAMQYEEVFPVAIRRLALYYLFKICFSQHPRAEKKETYWILSIDPKLEQEKIKRIFLVLSLNCVTLISSWDLYLTLFCLYLLTKYHDDDSGILDKIKTKINEFSKSFWKTKRKPLIT